LLSAEFPTLQTQQENNTIDQVGKEKEVEKKKETQGQKLAFCLS